MTEREPSAPADRLPSITTMRDLIAHEGQTARIEGWYEVTPVPGGKGLQAAAIVLSDGTRLLRSYRPVPDELGWNERRVVVIGKAYQSANEPAYVQQVMAPHVFPETISLHPSEPPAPRVDSIPTPPTVTSLVSLQARAGRWAQVFGQLGSVRDSSSGEMWAEVTVQLDDGTVVVASTVTKRRWQPLEGGHVSFLARVSDRPDDDGRYSVMPAMFVCKGRVERCGMD